MAGVRIDSESSSLTTDQVKEAIINLINNNSALKKYKDCAIAVRELGRLLGGALLEVPGSDKFQLTATNKDEIKTILHSYLAPPPLSEDQHQLIYIQIGGDQGHTLLIYQHVNDYIVFQANAGIGGQAFSLEDWLNSFKDIEARGNKLNLEQIRDFLMNNFLPFINDSLFIEKFSLNPVLVSSNIKFIKPNERKMDEKDIIIPELKDTPLFYFNTKEEDAKKILESEWNKNNRPYYLLTPSHHSTYKGYLVVTLNYIDEKGKVNQLQFVGADWKSGFSLIPTVPGVRPIPFSTMERAFQYYLPTHAMALPNPEHTKASKTPPPVESERSQRSAVKSHIAIYGKLNLLPDVHIQRAPDEVFSTASPARDGTSDVPPKEDNIPEKDFVPPKESKKFRSK